ncbi:hypothetical protein B0H13DRAFT_1853393 [Mycena leptocephala]|nr:hypothetical protein B0H13DRAFT_1853393 [Mycena leptocephala]
MAPGSSNTKRKAAHLDASANHVGFSVPSRNGNQKSTAVIDRLTSVSTIPTAYNSASTSVQNPNDCALPEMKKKTQSAQLLDDFGENFDQLGQFLLEYEADGVTGQPCRCGRDGRTANTKCDDCTGYGISCEECFVKAHLQNPFHWAEIWDCAQEFFVQHDLLKLGHVIQLGHNGGPCPSPVAERLFTVVDDNGIHSTRLRFCGCHELPPNKIKQLMRSRLFPATTREPETAFTINMLKRFQLHNLESKKAAYDHMGAIRRLTDNSFTANVPVSVQNLLVGQHRNNTQNPYSAFLRVVRVFNFLTLQKRTGQLNGIDTILAHRPNGNLIVWCPACPEPAFNSDPNCPKTPHHLRHLNQSQRTLDGNFQCNQFNKNTDPDDVSLCAGKGYFPLDSKYKEYLALIPISKEKSTCNYLKAVNKQDKRKFKNMAITGTICMELEKHQPDESFKINLRSEIDPVKLRLEVEDIDQVTTYDIACEYFINLEKRFQKSFPDLVPMVKRMRWGVPALHVQGHQDSCTYLFGTAYMECVGHFHGETAEQYWPEANQLGPHVRQMNNGHRQDTMINHHGDWNHKKTMDIAEDLAEAKRKYIEKRNHFMGLSASFHDRVQTWQQEPRTSTRKGKEAISVYKHKTTKETIYQKMLKDESVFGSTTVPKSKVAKFIDEGLKIQDVQFKIRQLIADMAEHDLVSRQKEIAKRTVKAQVRIAAWRKMQNQLMPHIGDKVAAQAMQAPSVQDEILFLPSDFPTETQRRELGILNLAMEEAKWREGQAFDHLRALQNIVKTISALRNRKTRDDRKQKENTRAGDNIRNAIALRDEHMASYEAARQALVTLDAASNFPPLTESDLYMKSVQQKRRVGDSRHTDGSIWQAQASIPIEEDIAIEDQEEQAVSKSSVNGTQMDKRRSGPHNHKPTAPKIPADERPDGWLWHLGKLSKMSDSEMEEWLREGDRVQWFRAEAEMQRWQEHREQKIAELLRVNRSFQKMQQTWTTLAFTNSLTGHQAYARQKAAMYCKRAEQAQTLITAAGYRELLYENASIVRRIQLDRDQEAKIVAEALVWKMNLVETDGNAISVIQVK